MVLSSYHQMLTYKSVKKHQMSYIKNIIVVWWISYYYTKGMDYSKECSVVFYMDNLFFYLCDQNSNCCLSHSAIISIISEMKVVAACWLSAMSL